MPPPKDHLDQLKRLAMSGCDTKTLALTATALWGQSKEEAKADHAKIMTQFALEATALDILGEMMLKYRQQEHHVDVMSRDLKKDDLPASFHNTYRLAINNCMATLLNIREVRDADGRNRTENPEQEEDRKKEAARQSIEHQAIGERQRMMGYFYDTRYGLTQAGIDLLSEDCAIRDVIRMRMLPKSPYEDHMFAKMFDALSEDEKKIDPETLSKEEVQTDLHTWDAEEHGCPGMTQYQEYDKLAQKIFLERLKQFNDTWAKAEKHVDGLMKKLGLKPRMVHPYVGLPPIIQQAAEGNPEAIAELKSLISPLPFPGEGPGVRGETRDDSTSNPDPTQDSAPSTQDCYERDWGKASTIIIAILLAFTSMWTCLTLIAGPTALAIVMPCEPNDVILLDDMKIEQTINRQDAENAECAKNTSHANPLDPWRSLASWRFNPSDHPFFDAFSSTPNPSG